MNEQERAAFYQSHKDDPDIWGDAEKRDKPRQRENLSATITVRFSPREANAIRRLAEERSLSYSDIIREAVQAYAEPSHAITNRVLTQDYSGLSVVTTGHDIRSDHVLRIELSIVTRTLAKVG